MWLGPPFMKSQITDLARAGKCVWRGASGLDWRRSSPAGSCAHNIELRASIPMPPPPSARKSRRERAVWVLPRLSFIQPVSDFTPSFSVSLDIDKLVSDHEDSPEVIYGL